MFMNQQLNNYLFNNSKLFVTIMGEPTKKNGKVRIIEKPIYVKNQNGQVQVDQNGQPILKLNKNGRPQSRFSMYLAVRNPNQNQQPIYLWGTTVAQSDSKIADLYRSWMGRKVQTYMTLVPSPVTNFNDEVPTVNIERIKELHTRTNGNVQNYRRSNRQYSQQNGQYGNGYQQQRNYQRPAYNGRVAYGQNNYANNRY